MFSKTVIISSLLRVATTALLCYFSVNILTNKSSGKDGLARLSLNLSLLRRDFPQPFQAITSQAVAVKSVAVNVAPTVAAPITAIESMIPSIVSGVASRATAAISSVIGDAAERIGHVLPTNCSVGTKYVCVKMSEQLSCFHVIHLEIILVLGMTFTLMSLVTFAFKVFLPPIGIITLPLSLLGLLFFVVFASCTIFIRILASVIARSSAVQLEKGSVLTDSIGSLVCATIWVAIGVLELVHSKRPFLQ